MSIKRAARPDSNFYVLDKSISEDGRLSWAARGVLIYLLGKPDHWEVSIQHLVNQTKDSRKRTGRDGTYAILKELESAGYLRRDQSRDSGAFGKIDYIVSESPHTDKPYTGEAYTANTTQVSTEGLARNETPARNDNPIGPSRSGDAPAEALADDAFELFWLAGMRKANKKRARAAFDTALKAAGQSATPRAFAESLVADVKRRIAVEQMGFDKMHPAAYLGDERWEDDLPAKPAQPGRQDGRKGFAQPQQTGTYTPTDMGNLPDWVRD